MGLENNNCNVAIIGAGNMALEHIKAFSDMDNVTIVGIFSRTKSKAEELAQKFHIPLVAESVEELHAKTHADLVIVTVYETSMLDVTLKAISLPWTIFIEKPPGYNLEQALQIQDRANFHNRKVLVGLNRRFLSSTQNVQKSLEQLSDQRFINIFDQQSLALSRSLKHEDKVVSHCMYTNSIHLVDYMCFLCRGEVEEVNLLSPWQPDVSMSLNALVKFDSGDQALYQGLWEVPGPWAISATTKTIRWEMRPLEKATYQMAGERKLNPIEINKWDEEFKPGFRLQAEHAILYTLGLESMSPTIHDAIKTMKLINKIYSR